MTEEILFQNVYNPYLCARDCVMCDTRGPDESTLNLCKEISLNPTNEDGAWDNCNEVACQHRLWAALGPAQMAFLFYLEIGTAIK